MLHYVVDKMNSLPFFSYACVLWDELFGPFQMKSNTNHHYKHHSDKMWYTTIKIVSEEHEPSNELE